MSYSYGYNNNARLRQSADYEHLSSRNSYYSYPHNNDDRTEAREQFSRSFPRSFRKPSWPPSPIVESETESLAKEANPDVPTNIADVPLRGTIDQKPEVVGPFSQDRYGNIHLDSESDLSSGTWSDLSSVCGSTPSSVVSGQTKARRPVYNDSGYVHVSDAETQRLNAEKRRQAFLNECFKSDTLRDDGKSRSNQKDRMGLAQATVEDDWIEVTQVPTRASAPYSLNSDALRVKENITPDSARVAGPKTQAQPMADRRAGDSVNPSKTQPSTKPPPLKPYTYNPNVSRSPVTTPSARTGTALDYMSQPKSDYGPGSRPQSPLTSATNRAPPSPGNQLPYWQSPGSKSNSRPNSRPGSRDSSRAPSPHLEESLRRSSTFPLSFSSDQPKRSSKLAASTTINDLPSQSSSLPYPVDNVLSMPSELEHMYSPTVPDFGKSLVFRDANTVTDATPRPRPVSRHSMDTSMPPSTRTKPSRRDSSSPIQGNLPCPRSHSSRDFDDWYTLSGCPNFDICPGCLDQFFGASSLRSKFKRQRRKAFDEKTKCDFASPWMRQAFSQMQKKKEPDLKLIKEISAVNADEQSCTGERRDCRRWYTVRDPRGNIDESLAVCPRDKAKIDILFPSLRGCFIRSPHSGKTGTCDMRATADTFPEAIKCLAMMEYETEVRGRRPTMQAFMNIFSEVQASSKPVCPRDDPKAGGDWHIIPRLSFFTVCQACYTTVVWPAITSGSQLADLFSRTPRRIGPNNADDRRGATCQLYSPHMRKVFSRAVQKKDLDYLEMRARERKDNEVRLVDEYLRIQQDPRLSNADKEGIARRIAKEWTNEYE